MGAEYCVVLFPPPTPEFAFAETPMAMASQPVALGANPGVFDPMEIMPTQLVPSV
jgi:hypothetical protein